ncbi:ADP-ribosylglycohydrolase family protein [Arthrobacter sp. JZ12]|uniref:ADP-ribosylglycohydrolase family protein n=1 Tax=Arthrobacter sp. JZ12 TaxID=2654190 RepID=UPI002B4685DD|nr:ADP-ribosylglycohydrolase family protein [Arthrobacter sp. JZ12]WRH25220.1 ADP-ribosylglycohydrolase family protein [Arthrobacter sp. JZ12]
MTSLPDLRSRIAGSLLAGALGEASANSSHGTGFGSATQLTLYTVDGLTEALEWANDGVAADETACLWLAYLRWLGTQGELPPSSAPAPPARWIDRQEVLRRRHHPDPVTLRSLASGEMGTRQRPLETNDGGPGALGRSAPFGLVANVPAAMIERLTLDAAAITHGNASAQVPAAVFAALVHEIAINGLPLGEAVAAAASTAKDLDAEGLAACLQDLVRSAASDRPTADAGESDAGQSDAGESDAAGILCRAVRLVLATSNSDGEAHVSAVLAASADREGRDASVASAVAGNIVGALHGVENLPEAALGQLDGVEVIREIAGRLASAIGS